MILRALVLALLAASCSWADEATSPAVRFAAGVEALKQDRPSEAAEAFDALAREVDSASVHYNLGLARYHQGRMGKAVAAWRRALDEARRRWMGTQAAGLTALYNALHDPDADDFLVVVGVSRTDDICQR